MNIFKGKNIFMKRGIMRGSWFEKQQKGKTHQSFFIETMKSQMQRTKFKINGSKNIFFQCKKSPTVRQMISKILPRINQNHGQISLLQTIDKHFKFSSLLPQCHTTKGPKLSLIIIVNHSELRNHSNYTQNDAHISLRGGGCGSSKREMTKKYKVTMEIKQQVPFYFFTDFIKYLEIIINKATTAQDERQREELLLALQWFNVMQEHLNTFCSSLVKVIDAQNWAIPLVVVERIKHYFNVDETNLFIYQEYQVVFQFIPTKQFIGPQFGIEDYIFYVILSKNIKQIILLQQIIKIKFHAKNYLQIKTQFQLFIFQFYQQHSYLLLWTLLFHQFSFFL